MNLDQAVVILSERVLGIEARLRRTPDLRQGLVTDKTLGPPMRLTVTIDEGSYPGVYCTDSSVVDGDTVWVLVLPGGVRIAIGDLK